MISALARAFRQAKGPAIQKITGSPDQEGATRHTDEKKRDEVPKKSHRANQHCP
jgi:hypothetical protein